MKPTILIALVLGLLGLASLGSGSARAQESDPPPPIHTSVDANGVDLISGQLTVSKTYVTIGDPKQGGMSWTYFGGLIRDNYYGAINSSGSTYIVSLGGSSINFTVSGSTFTSQAGDGSTLTASGSTLTLTLRDGSIATFSTTYAAALPTQANIARIVSLTDPYGVVTSFFYKTFTIGSSPVLLKCVRLQGVTNTLGYEVKLQYVTSNGTNSDLTLSRITGVNNSIEYCNPSADTCSLTNPWPYAAVSGSSVTDALGRTTTFPYSTIASSTQTWTRPGGPNWTVVTDSSSRVTSMSNGVGTWTYAYAVNSPTETTTVTDPLGHTRVVVSNLSTLLVTSDTNGTGNTSTYAYDSYGRMTKQTTPLGMSTGYVYDARGNVTETETDQISGGSGPTIKLYANYDATCANAIKCNQPNWTKDGVGNETDYYYGSNNLLNEVLPPAGANGLRNEQDVIYVQQYAYYNQGSGVAQAPSPVWRAATHVLGCPNAQNCWSGNQYMASWVAFQTATTGNNLLIIGSAFGKADGSLYASRGYTYDMFGNLQSSADPRGYSTAYFYDADRELLGVVGPDPDGSGPLHNRAARLTYDAAGRVTLAEQGTTLSQSASDWANFSSLAQVATSYDAAGRKAQVNQNSGGATRLATQYAYDNANRPTCTAQRMNSYWYSSLPSSACQASPISPYYGQDPISLLGYDNADRVTTLTTGYQSTVPRTESTTTYTADGLAQTQIDAKGNKTTYVYDGFDHLSQVQYPTPSNGGVSTTADYEQYSYDNDFSLSQDRRRDGRTLTYSYDGARRLSSVSDSAGTLGYSYTYDNLGRVLSAAGGGQTLSYTYDAMNRALTESGPLGTISAQYDLSGNRTQLTWPDGWYVNYTYDADSEVTSIADRAVTLTTYAYNDLGQRTQVSRPGVATTTYGYDAALHLTALTHSLTDGSKTEALTYGYSPTGQLQGKTSSNPLYDWTTSAAITRSYATDGQNRYTSSGGVALSYDARGNTANDTQMTYSYDTMNHLTSLGNGATLTYDADNRLSTTVGGSTTTRFLYEGAQIVAEYNSGGVIQRRFVPGPGPDEPIVWYEGASQAGGGDRRWLLADRQGSVIAAANSSGTTVGINTYDETGIPASGNIGRFQFDGAPWIPEIGLYHMRARAYSPTLGRFMQSDPIGYGDGLNWYNYAHGDPVNGWDPSGLDVFDDIGNFFAGVIGDIGDFFSGAGAGGYDYCPGGTCGEVTVTAKPNLSGSGSSVSLGSSPSSPPIGGVPTGVAPGPQSTTVAGVTVTAKRPTCAASPGASLYDTYNLSISLPNPLRGFTRSVFGFHITIDSYGRVYGGFHGGVGTLSVSFTVQDVPQIAPPSPQQLNSIITGASTSIDGGAIVGGAASFNSSGSTVGAGLVSGVGVTTGTSSQLGQIGTPPC